MASEHQKKQSGWVTVEEEVITDKKEIKRQRKIAKKLRQKRKGCFQRICELFVSAGTLAVIYCVLVFSHIPFIEKWRTIYIETAMGTMTHQWMATLFIPRTVIDDVMNSREVLRLRQDEYNSRWEENNFLNPDEVMNKWDDMKHTFARDYPEIDQRTFGLYMKKHDLKDLLDDDGYLIIDHADYKDEETGIMTQQGDKVCAIDTRNGIVILDLEGEGYRGRMAIVKNPAQMELAISKTYGAQGTRITHICEAYDAVLGTNASGFFDPGGKGDGGTADGFVLAHGTCYNDYMNPDVKVIAMDNRNRLLIDNALPEHATEAIQFSPALVINGEQLISGSAGWGLQPRAAIGQTANGQILLAVVDGRQPGHSLGITLGDLADIMVKYDVYQACNMDGGSSAVMYFRGRNITVTSSTNPKEGRRLPNAWVVKARQ